MLMSVVVFIGIDVINIYNYSELMISLITLIGLTISNNNCKSNINSDDNS